MPRNPLLRCALCAFLLAGAMIGHAIAEVIDFETLPGGAATVDLQEISDEYAVHGVTFTLLDRVTGLPAGFPRIAKAGLPATAFHGCYVHDTPLPHLDLGESFLTDGTEVGVEADLLIEYATAVAQASGIILDIDCRYGVPPCEQWTITAFDEFGAALDSVVLDGIIGTSNPDCIEDAGPGDSEAFGWTIDVGTAQIRSILLRYTGTASLVGLAFDEFSVAGAPGPPLAGVVAPADTVCADETVTLMASVSGGSPPFTFQWQQETSPGTWQDLGTASTQEIRPTATADYRVAVTDNLSSGTTSPPAKVTVLADDPLCLDGLLVSSFDNDRLVRYSIRSGLPQVLVPTGSGGLAGPSKLVCHDGDVYVSDQPNDRVLRYDGTTGASLGVFVAARSGGLVIPIGLDFGPDGDLFVASYNTNEVLRYDGDDGSFLGAFIPAGSGLNGPTGLLFGPDGHLYVCSFTGDKVLRFDGVTGASLGDFVTTGSGGLDSPRGLDFGPDGRLYVSEQYNDSVRRYNEVNGDFIDVFIAAGTGGLDRANDLVFAPDGVLYVASYENDKILRFDAVTGALLGELPNDPLNGPAWVTVGCGPLAVSGVPGAPPRSLDLAVEPGVPNPFNPRTTVAFNLDLPGHTRVAVYDVAGRLVATPHDGHLPAGRNTVEWNGRTSDGRAAPSGVYFLLVRNERAQGRAKVMLVR